MTIGSKEGLAVPSAKYAALTLAQRLLVVLFVGVGVWYLAWRPGTFNPDAMLFSAVVYGAELFGFACAMLYLAMCWRLRRRAPLPVPPNATVAVFVPTINESVDIVRRTRHGGAAHEAGHTRSGCSTTATASRCTCSPRNSAAATSRAPRILTPRPAT